MTTFRFTGDATRIFDQATWQVDEDTPRGHVEPGAVIEAEENPDPVFFEAVKASATRGSTKQED